MTEEQLRKLIREEIHSILQESDEVEIKVQSRPGVIGNIMRILKSNNMNSVVWKKGNKEDYVFVKKAKLEKVHDLLQKYNIDNYLIRYVPLY